MSISCYPASYLCNTLIQLFFSFVKSESQITKTHVFLHQYIFLFEIMALFRNISMMLQNLPYFLE